MPTDPNERINCRACRHFAVTWDPALPYGCRVFGFKSKTMPSVDVYANSGKPCQAFEPKDPNARPENPPKKILA